MLALPPPSIASMSMRSTTVLTDWASAHWSSSQGLGGPDGLHELLAQFRQRVRRDPGSRARLNRPIAGPRQVRPLPPRPAGDTPLFVFSPSPRRSYVRWPWAVSMADLVFAHPRRDFSRRRNQLHRPVSQYAQTVGDLVMCESRLERSFVLLADWTPAVVHIVAQPFTILFPVGWSARHHTPDFLVLSADHPPLIVDVKRPEQAELRSVIERHLLVGRLLAICGLAYSVWTGMPAAVTNNLDGFAGASVPLMTKHRSAVEASVHRWVERNDLTASAIAERLEAEHRIPSLVGLAVIQELLWQQVVRTNMYAPFTRNSVIRR